MVRQTAGEAKNGNFRVWSLLAFAFAMCFGGAGCWFGLVLVLCCVCGDGCCRFYCGWCCACL